MVFSIEQLLVEQHRLENLLTGYRRHPLENTLAGMRESPLRRIVKQCGGDSMPKR